MKWCRFIQDKSGFTIQETLVALLISSILFSLGLSVFSFVNNQYMRWQSKEETKRHVDKILQILLLDVQQSRDVVELTDSTLMLSKGIGEPIVYRCSGSTTLRNGVELNPSGSLELMVKAQPQGGQLPVRILYLEVSGKLQYWEYSRSGVATILPSSRAEFSSTVK